VKHFLLLIAIFISIFVNAKTYKFAGEVKQAGNTDVTITIYNADGFQSVIQCEQEEKVFGTKTFFSIDLEKDSYYTLLFQSGDYAKLVYIDTHNIRSFYGYECRLLEEDAIIYFDPIDGYPIAFQMRMEYLEFLCNNFHVVSLN